MAYRYQNTAIGGTFDLLHKGHISLLEKAFSISKFVTIGITTDKFCKEAGKPPFETQSLRKKNLQNFLKTKRWQMRSKIIWLSDIYGTAPKNKTVQAIVVSKDTVAGANQINKKRIKSKLKNLKIVICREVDSDDGKKISSTRIRAGEISPDGLNYLAFLLKISNIRFGNKIRDQLKKSFGKYIKVYQKEKLTKPIIAVGDQTTQNLLKNKVMPDLSIIDFMVKRERKYNSLVDLGFVQSNPDYLVKNEPGQISKELIAAVAKTIRTGKNGQIILVDGEEDLAFIPALLLSPFPATVFYGQPGKGQIISRSSIETKNRLCSILGLS